MKPNVQTNTSTIALMGLLFSLSLVLTTVEYLIPPLPMLPPGVKIGLSNIVTMYCLFFLGRKPALTIVLLKSGYVFFIRGFTAFLMSLSGGLLSTLVMLLLTLAATNFSYLAISIAGAISHNIGQIVVASIFLGTGLMAAYLPILILSGVIMGNITGTLLKVVMPAFHLFSKNHSQLAQKQSQSGLLRKDKSDVNYGGRL